MCNRDALHVLSLISKSGARHALLTTFETFEEMNVDISCDSGGYRALNLQKAPFNLRPPMHFWPEDYPVDQRVGLGLWELPLPPQPSPSPSPSPDDIEEGENASAWGDIEDDIEDDDDDGFGLWKQRLRPDDIEDDEDTGAWGDIEDDEEAGSGSNDTLEFSYFWSSPSARPDDIEDDE